MRDNPCAGRRGFTLLELLVVLSVLSVVTTIGVVMLGRLMDYHRDVSARESASAQAEQVLEMFRADASAVLPGAGHVALDPEAGKLSMVVSAPAADTGRTPAAPIRVTYRTEKEDGSTVLIREESPVEAHDAPARVTWRTEADKVFFSAASGAAWLGVWQQPEPPDAIRLMLEIIPGGWKSPGRRPVVRFVDVNLGTAQP